MHGAEVKEVARALRLNGVKVQVMASALGVSTGWASKATVDVVQGDSPRGLLQADREALDSDRRSHAPGRARRLGSIGSRRMRSLRDKVSDLMAALGAGAEEQLPHWKSAEYKRLDRLQQQFTKDPEHPLIALVAREYPPLLSHLVEWKRSRHRQTQDKSDSGFVAVAQRVHDYVMRTRRPPSVGDSDLQVQQDAQWLWRWKANANGRIGRKRNLDRAHLFCEIGLIVEMLMSQAPAVHLEGIRQLESGRWTGLFNALASTKNDYRFVRRRLKA